MESMVAIDKNLNNGIAVAKACVNSEPLSIIGDTHFNVSGIIIQNDFDNETGSEIHMCYIITSDGKSYRTRSTGIYNDCSVLVNTCGDYIREGNAVECYIETLNLNNGHTLKKLRLC